jgi:hypothetical protein
MVANLSRGRVSCILQCVVRIRNIILSDSLSVQAVNVTSLLTDDRH